MSVSRFWKKLKEMTSLENRSVGALVKLSHCASCGEIIERGRHSISFNFKNEIVTLCYKYPKCEDLYDSMNKENKEFELREAQQQNKCIYFRAWIGSCKKDGFPYCKEHSEARCCSCGKQAVGGCSHSLSFVCGADLCETCDHDSAGIHRTKRDTRALKRFSRTTRFYSHGPLQ